MPLDPTKQQTIKLYNQKQAAKGATPSNNQQQQQSAKPALGFLIGPTKSMSTAEIELIQKHNRGEAMSNEELVKLKALATKENLKQAAIDQKLAEKEQKEKQQQQQIEAEQDKKAHDKAVSVLARGLSNVQTPMQPSVNWLSNLPTPGGIATMLIIIFVFLFAIVPVDSNGNTRLKLLFLTLQSKTHLQYQDAKSGITENTGNVQASQNVSSPPSQTTQIPNFVLPPGIDLFNV